MKKRRHAKPTPTREEQLLQRIPPDSHAAEARFYAEEENRGVYSEFWQNMGYWIDHGADFPPYPPTSSARPKNRTRGWTGVFEFAWYWQEPVPEPTRNAILQTLTQDYGCTVVEGEGTQAWHGSVQLNGNRVKNLTRMLNRQFRNHYLVWREI